MTWILLLTITFMLAAIVLIELRAVRAGDEREHHAPGYAYVLIGLVALSSAIGMALMDQTLFAMLLSTVGLMSVGVGTLGEQRHAGSHPRGQQH